MGLCDPYSGCGGVLCVLLLEPESPLEVGMVRGPFALKLLVILKPHPTVERRRQRNS